MEQKLVDFVGEVSSFVWGPPMLILLVGTGIYLTFLLKGLQFRSLFHSLYLALIKRKESGAARIFDDYSQFKKEIEDPGGFYNVHWCGSRDCEDRLQNETKATIRCIPLENKAEKGKCLLCGSDSEERVVIAKAY